MSLPGAKRALQAAVGGMATFAAVVIATMPSVPVVLAVSGCASLPQTCEEWDRLFAEAMVSKADYEQRIAVARAALELLPPGSAREEAERALAKLESALVIAQGVVDGLNLIQCAICACSPAETMAAQRAEEMGAQTLGELKAELKRARKLANG